MMNGILKRARRIAAGSALAVALLAPLGSAAVAPPETAGRLVQVFDFYFGGIWVGEAALDATVAPGGYSADARMHTSGLARFLFDASFNAEAEGGIAGDAMLPSRFVAKSRDEKNAQDVDIVYANGVPAEVKAEPAFKVRDYSIDATRQGQVADPLTGALSALAPRADGFCNRRVEMFDGHRRFAIVLDAPQPDGDEVKCPGRYERVAGFKPKMMKPDRRTIPFTMWFEKRADGLYQTRRVLVPTDYANVTMVRRD